ncbi:MAG: hypothetical protein ACTHOH_02760 [Lysobacteraceae bacterium]
MARNLHAIADRVEREAFARAALAEGRPFARAALTSAAWLALTVIAVNATTLPTVTQFWLLLGLSPVPAALIELHHVRRRLEAALVLLEIAQHKPRRSLLDGRQVVISAAAAPPPRDRAARGTPRRRRCSRRARRGPC